MPSVILLNTIEPQLLIRKPMSAKRRHIVQLSAWSFTASAENRQPVTLALEKSPHEF